MLPAKLTEVATGAAVVFTATEKLPLALASGPRSMTSVPAIRPANPAPETTSRPVPPVRVTPWPEPPRASSTPARPRTVTAPPSGPVPRCSSRSARSCWPARLSVSPLATTRSAVVAVGVVSTSTLICAASPSAGTATVAVRLPVRPAAVIVSCPATAVIEAAPPRSRPPSERVTVRSVPLRSKVRVPVSATPPKPRVASATLKRVTRSPVKARVTPASVLPGISSVVATASPVVLTSTAVVPLTVSPATPTMLTVPEATSA